MNETDFMNTLKQRLLVEFSRQDRSGVYGYTQRSMAYNSNRIEGSTLTERQTASLFDTGSFYPDSEDDIFRAKDVEEMNGHFKMFNYMLKNLGKSLTTDIIKQMHKELKEGVFEDLANGYAVGDWKKRKNIVGTVVTALPEEVPERMEQLVKGYTEKDIITLEDIVRFHVEFEQIHPFQDGNGRVGRMILLKQCLDANIIPVVIRDINKLLYYRCLEQARTELNYGRMVRYFEAEQTYYQEQVSPMLFEHSENQ